jgi:hypothetical protein
MTDKLIGRTTRGLSRSLVGPGCLLAGYARWHAHPNQVAAQLAKPARPAT